MSLRPDEQSLFDTVPGAVVAADDMGRIAYMNAEARRLFRLGEEPAGKPLASLMPARMRERHAAGFARYRQTGESRLLGQQVRVPALRGDGTEFEIELTLRMFQRPDGSRLILASITETTNAPNAPRHVIELETRLVRRAYQLI